MRSVPQAHPQNGRKLSPKSEAGTVTLILPIWKVEHGSLNGFLWRMLPASPLHGTRRFLFMKFSVHDIEDPAAHSSSGHRFLPARKYAAPVTIPASDASILLSVSQAKVG
jgi:hypothetical protein